MRGRAQRFRHTNECKEVRSNLWEWTKTPESYPEVALHLDACPACRTLAAKIYAALEAQRELANEPLSKHGEVCILGSLNAAIQAKKDALPRRGYHSWRPALAIAASLFMVAIGLWYFLLGRSSMQSETPLHATLSPSVGEVRLLDKNGTLRPASGNALAITLGDTVLVGANSQTSIEVGPDRIMAMSGSEIQLKRAAKLNTQLSLKRGALLAHVEPHHRGRRFRVSTPFGYVVVTGTVFHMKTGIRDAQVQVARGGVVMHLKHGRPVRVVAGERLVTDGWHAKTTAISKHESQWLRDALSALSTGRTLLHPEPAPLTSDGISMEAETDGAVENSDGKGDSHSLSQHHPKRRHQSATSNRSWLASAKVGNYQQALQEIKRQGVTRVLKLSSADDLRLIADTTRLAGDFQLAKRVLLLLRHRFPRHPASSLSAFHLGRLAQEHQRDFKQAARWFRVYLAEHPDSVLAGDTSGRLMTVLSSAGDERGARRAAKNYLKKYPQGKYATFAKNLLKKDSQR